MSRGWTVMAIVAAAAAIASAAALAVSSRSSSGGAGSSYVQVAVPASADDRAAAAALAAAGFGPVVSESTSWVLLDDFGAGERVPLDRWRDRVEASDPRDDGYADALRSVFENGSERYLYVPRPWASLSGASFEKKLEALLPGSSAVPLGGGAGFSLFCALAGLGAAGVAYLINRGSTAWLFALPALAALSGAGPGGLACAGFALASYAALSRFLDEVRRGRASRPSKLSDERATMVGVAALRSALGPWALDSLPTALAFGAASAAAAIFSGLRWNVFVLSALAALLAAFAWLEAESRWTASRGRRRFVPVALKRRGPSVLAGSSLALLPFAAAAALALLLVPAGTGRALPSTGTVLAGVGDDAYQRHAAFQAGFRRSNLADPARGSGYPGFAADGKGLLVPAPSPAAQGPAKTELPPAERLVAELGGSRAPRQGPGVLTTVIATLALALPAGIVALMRKRRSKESASTAEKRIAA